MTAASRLLPELSTRLKRASSPVLLPRTSSISIVPASGPKADAAGYLRYRGALRSCDPFPARHARRPLTVSSSPATLPEETVPNDWVNREAPELAAADIATRRIASPIEVMRFAFI